MPHLLRKLLYWDFSAKGALFALTVLFVGSALWFTLFQLTWLSDCGLVRLNIMSEETEGELKAWAGVQLLIALYALAVFLRATWLLVGNCRHLHDFRPLACALPSLALFVCGILVCLLPAFPLLKVLSTYGNPFDTIPSWAKTVFAHIPPRLWGVVHLAAAACIAASGFLIVQAFAKGEGLPVRAAVSKPVLVLWGIFWTAYLVILALALTQSHRVAQTRALVEQRFGHPLTAEGLREFYFSQGTPDANYWKRLGILLERLPQSLAMDGRELEYWDWKLPDECTPEFLAAFEDYCKANEAVLLEAETCLDAVPPLSAYAFQPGNLLSFEGQPPFRNRLFAILEYSRLRVFLNRQDKQNALRAYRRIANYASHAQREPYLIGGLVWRRVESIRLDAIERMLESRLLSKDDLRLIDADLATLEEGIPAILRQIMYTEAVFGQDCTWGLETGKAPDALVAFADLRFFYPQLWLQAALDQENILRQYLAEDFSTMATPHRSAFVFSCALLPALKPAGDKFHALTARIRATRAQLRADAPQP